MIDDIREILHAKCRVAPEDKLLVGVSGGPDSLCLLDVLDRLGFPLIVAHLDHGLRPEAGADALEVKRLAESRNLPFALGKEDVHAYAESHSVSLEESARILRYRFLFAKARQFGARSVAVGHSADDQVETVLMHLLRGAGLSGLKGMQFRALPNAWSEDIALIRPLLGVWRKDILNYLSERNLEPLMDRTNLDITIYRNRLRHELIPYLQGFNPAVREVVWRMAEVLAGDYEILEAMIDEAWSDCLIMKDSGYVALNVDEVERRPVGMQRHIFRRAIGALRPGLRDVDFESVERALEFLETPPATKQRDLVAGLRLLLEGNRVWVATWEADLPGGRWPQLPNKQGQTLKVPGELRLSEGWYLKADVVEKVENARAQALANDDPYRAWIDQDKVSVPLKIRARRPGDRFRPLGMEGHSVKLADFMVNVKLPRRAREKWPLVVSEGEIVWVPGLRLGHPFRLTMGTERPVRLSLERVNQSKES